MNNYDKILKYAEENNGYVTTKEIENLKLIVHFCLIWSITKK